MIEERKDDPEPVVLDKPRGKKNVCSPAAAYRMNSLTSSTRKYESIADEKSSFVASNVVSTRNYEIRTPDVIIKVSPEKAQLIETRTIDGTPYILIEAADEVEINGILLNRHGHPMRMIPNFNSQMTASLSHCPKKKAAVPDKRAAAFSSFFIYA